MLLQWTILLWWISAITHHSVWLIFCHSLLLRLSEHQTLALCQAWTYSQILMMEQKIKWVQLTENFMGQLRKRKSNRPLNPKPIGLCRMLFLVLQKGRREGFAKIQIHLNSIRSGHWSKCSFRWRFHGRRGTGRWLCVVYWSFLWRPKWRRVDTMCKTFQVGAHTLFVSLVMDKHCFVFSLHPLYR